MAANRWGIWMVVAGLGLLWPTVGRSQDPDEYKKRVLAASKKIDDLIYAQQKEAGVKAGEKAGDGTYFRRLNIDLIGRIPTFLDIDNFLDDDSEDKRWTWVEKMLAHERVPAHLAAIYRHQILGSPNQMTAFLQPQFENFLKKRFEKNVGYDQIVREILSTGLSDGRMVPGGGGFVAGGAMPENPGVFFFANENKPENLAAATTRVFLGVKLECAQCHAHPFAKWTKEQFWEFAAFYSARTRFVPPMAGMPPRPPIVPGEIEIPGTKKTVKAKFLDGAVPEMGDKDPQQVLADWVSLPKNPFFAKATADFVWSNFFGVSLLEPIIEPSEDAPITHPEILDLLTKELIESKFDLKHLMRILVHTDAYQRASTGKGKAAPEDYHLFVRMPVRGMTPEQLFDSFIEATTDKVIPTSPLPGGPRPFGAALTPRAEFLVRFATQDRRHETQTSILQALYLMNGKLMNDLTDPEKNESLKRVIFVGGTDNRTKVRTLYKLVLSRLPNEDELGRMERYVNEGGPARNSAVALADVYWALLNCGEFMLNH